MLKYVCICIFDCVYGVYVYISMHIHIHIHIHTSIHTHIHAPAAGTASLSHIVPLSCPPPVDQSTVILNFALPIIRSHLDKYSILLPCVLSFLLSQSSPSLIIPTTIRTHLTPLSVLLSLLPYPPPKEARIDDGRCFDLSEYMLAAR